MAFCFFTESSKLDADQDPDNVYGRIDDNEYRLVNLFSASANPKAFAMIDGNILVQENTDNPDLVNIVLKPSAQTGLDLPKIDYIVYKNILKDSLITSDGIIADRSLNTLTKKIWDTYDFQVAAFQDDPDIELPENPLPEDILGYKYSPTDNEVPASDSDNLDFAFYDNRYPLFFIESGDYIGDFHSDEFGVLLFVEKIGSYLPFKVARESETKLSFSPLSSEPTDSEKFKRRHEKEAILAYIDSCAFFGSFLKDGLNVNNGSEFDEIKGQDLFDTVISKHTNKDKVYLDIRNESNDSINYYDDFGDILYWNLDNTDSFVEVNYYRDSWPILALSDSEVTTANNEKKIKLSFIKNEGITPIIYLKRAYSDSSGPDDLADEEDKFIALSSESDENGFSILPQNLLLPKLDDKIVASFLQLKYFSRIIENPDTSQLFFKNSYIDNLFPVFDMSIPFREDTGTPRFKLYYDICYNDKTLINSADFSANIGVAYDKSMVSFISFPQSYNNNVFANNDDTIPLGSMEGDAGSLFLNQLKSRIPGLKITIDSVVIQGVAKQFLQLSIDEENTSQGQLGSNYTLNDFSVITLTNQQFSDIKTIKETEFSDGYKVYLGITDLTQDADDAGVLYSSFKYVLNGIKEQDGAIVRHSVPTSIDAVTNVKILGTAYERNTEEKVGWVNKIGDKRYEDYFIEKITTIKTVVDQFINDINEINVNLPSANEQFTSVTKRSFSALWNAAKSYVQSNPSNPDDRPLYWGRIKMQVTLKQLAFFSTSIFGNNIITDSTLDKLIQISEESSRNYTNISFSSAQDGTTKILVTGFDPFFLDFDTGNILQSNPSGCCALALADTLTSSGAGYIQTLIAPVRYPDFDGSKSQTEGEGDGIIEKYIGPWVQEVDMIVTISQSLPGDYNIDKYATSRRGGTRDNLNFTRVSNSYAIDIGDESNEWILTALPDSFIVSPVKYNWTYWDASGNVIDNSDQLHTPQSGDVLQKGSGGNYLSNEIFYRVAKLRKETRAELPTGHFHISQLQTGNDDFSSVQTSQLIDIVKAAMNNGVSGL